MDNNIPYYDSLDYTQPQGTVSSSSSAQMAAFATSMNAPNADVLYQQYGNPYPQSSYESMPYTEDMNPAQSVGILLDGQRPMTVNEARQQKRQEQNRKAQKEFRQRREAKIKELQEELERTRQSYQSMSHEAGELRTSKAQLEAEIEKLMEENRRLRTSIESSPSSDLAWIPGPEEHPSAGPSRGSSRR